MGREIRKVSASWEHPKDSDGKYHPLFDEEYEVACKVWYGECIANKGKYVSDTGTAYWWHEWDGCPPDSEYYRDTFWSEEERTHIQMYETVSEGTPVSPVFATREELIKYLCERGDFWDQKRRKENRPLGMPCAPWTLENAEAFVNSGFAFSGIIANGKYHGPSEQGELNKTKTKS